MALQSAVATADRPYVSTGHLPEPEAVQSLVDEAHRRFKPNVDGKNSNVYPALARVPSTLFGVCVAAAGGKTYGAGDVASCSHRSARPLDRRKRVQSSGRTISTTSLSSATTGCAPCCK